MGKLGVQYRPGGDPDHSTDELGVSRSTKHAGVSSGEGDTMASPEAIARAQAVKARYEKKLMRKRNVVGVGVGFRERAGKETDAVCIVVSVRQKLPRDQLAPQDVIPTELDGVPVDVKATGAFRAL